MQIFLVVMKHCNLYLGLVLPSGGWQSLIDNWQSQQVTETKKQIKEKHTKNNWRIVKENDVDQFKSYLLLMIFWVFIIKYNS